MADIVVQLDADTIGYEAETTWGTDVATTRLAFPWDISRATFRYDEHKESRKPVGSSIDPAAWKRKMRTVELDVEGLLLDDKPSNSPFSFFLGSAPNGGTGIVTNYPDATTRNIRSKTVECGYTWPSTDEYAQIKGLRGKRLEVRAVDYEVQVKASYIGKDFARTTTRAAAEPALPTTLPFDGYNDSTITLATPTMDATEISNLAVIIENTLAGEKKGKVGGTRSIGHSQIAGRKVYVEIEKDMVNDEWRDMLEASPDAAAADVNVTWTLSKNAAAEFVKFTLSNCQIISQASLEFTADETEMKENYRLEAKTYELDVLTP